MSTEDKSLTAVTGLSYAYWNKSLTDESYSAPFVHPEDGNAFYFGWHSTYRTFQIRYKRRRRTRPTASKSGGWEGWGAWQGAEYCSKSSSRDTITRPSNTQDWDTWNMANARPSASTNLYSANRVVYKHYAAITPQGMGTYDAEQWQVEVRPYDESTKKHGPAKTATITVVYKPTFALATMTVGGQTVPKVLLADDGGILVYYTTNYNRDGNTVSVMMEVNGKTKIAEVADVKGGLNGEYFKIPASKLDKNYDVGDAFNLPMTFYAGYSTPSPSDTVTPNCIVRSKYAEHHIEPRMQPLDIDQAAHKVTVTVTEPGKTYPWTSVKVWAGWYGPDGVWRTVSPSKVVSESKTGRTGVYEFTNVPSDVVVRYRAQVESADSDSDDPATLQRSATLKSTGRAFLTIGERCAGLVCALENETGITWNRSYAPNVETEVCAGRQREVSRHGTGGTASVQVHGDIVYDTGAWDMGEGFRLADWEAMKRLTGADGFISLPQGIWAKVCVTGIDIDTERPAHSVTLSMEEVV